MIPNKLIKIIILPFSIMGIFTLCWLSAFDKMLIRWNSGDDSYCYLIFPLFFYICWENRERFNFAEVSFSTLAILPALLSGAAMIAGELGSVETSLYMGIWLACLSIGIFIYGKRLKYLIFPWIILLFMIPLPAFINNMLTFKLKLAASALASQMLHLSGVSLLREGNIIDLGVEKLQVVDACSGLRFFIPMFFMALLVGYFFNKRWYVQLILLTIVPPLAVLINGFRIYATALLLLGGYKRLAEGLFHDFAGWAVFMAGGTGLLLFSILLRKIETGSDKIFGKHVVTHTDTCTDMSDNMSLKTIITAGVMVIIFAGSAWSVSGSSMMDPSRIQRIGFSEFPMTLGPWTGTREYLSSEIMDSLWADDYVSARFKNSQNGNTIQLLIPYYEYQTTRHTAHAPQSCLLGGGWAILSSEEHIFNLNGKKTKIGTMVMRKDDFRLIASYCFFQRGRVITNPWMNKFYLMMDALTKQRTDGALVRAELFLGDDMTLDEGFTELEGFLGYIWPILPQYIPE